MLAGSCFKGSGLRFWLVCDSCWFQSLWFWFQRFMFLIQVLQIEKVLIGFWGFWMMSWLNLKFSLTWFCSLLNGLWFSAAFCNQWLVLNCFILWHFAMGSDEVAEVPHFGEQAGVCHSGSQQLVAADSGAKSSVESGEGWGRTEPERTQPERYCFFFLVWCMCVSCDVFMVFLVQWCRFIIAILVQVYYCYSGACKGDTLCGPVFLLF